VGDISKRRHGLGGADRAVDEAMAFQGGDDVAADLAARQFANLPPRHRLQISDRGQGKGLRPSDLGHVVPSQSGMGRKDRRYEAGFGAERIAAADEGEIVGTAARALRRADLEADRDSYRAAKALFKVGPLARLEFDSR
jgi:hypothetical protein